MKEMIGESEVDDPIDTALQNLISKSNEVTFNYIFSFNYLILEALQTSLVLEVFSLTININKERKNKGKNILWPLKL
jgi:hypothetical protein